MNKKAIAGAVVISALLVAVRVSASEPETGISQDYGTLADGAQSAVSAGNPASANSISYADLEKNAAKDTERKKSSGKYLGQLSGSFETNTIHYVEDNPIGFIPPEGNYGSNNYLKLDYNYKGFSAGLQAEWYPQVLQGYDRQFKGLGLPFLYLSWQNDFMSATVGSFYEQFGSGLLFRAWEDRTLGLNTAITGARLTFNIKDLVNIKVFSGLPRDYMKYPWSSSYMNYVPAFTEDMDVIDDINTKTARTVLTGLDVSFSLSEALKLEDHYFTVEGSLLHKYSPWIWSSPGTTYYYISEYAGGKVPSNVFSYSARLNYAYKGFSANFEYVGKGKEIVRPTDGASDAENLLKRGNAQLIDLSYSTGGLSVSAMFRRLENMRSDMYRRPDQTSSYTSNSLNYIPSRTTQHTYSLVANEPYNVNANDEIGGQIDVFYQFRRGTALGGKRVLKVHATFSTYYANSLKDGLTMATDETGAPIYDDNFMPVLKSYNNQLMYREFTFDIDKSFTKSFQALFMYSYQKHLVHIPDLATNHLEERHAFVLDMTFKFSRKYSLRTEFQYLYSPLSEDKDWCAALLEFNMAPKWSIYVSDMFNHGNPDAKHHYYQAGVAFTHSIVRAALSYGRVKEGYICSGGVCRFTPAYTGANLSLTVRF